jgi:hypothetical protein
MNAETLIKALKCCTSLETGCIDCPNIDLVTGVIAERETLQQWVNDLQSGMYVNCVYCGHRYGPAETTPVSMADALKEHIENCPKHPMSVLKAQLAESQRRERAARLEVCRRCPDGEIIDGVKHYPCDGCEWRCPEEGEPHETV